MVLVDTSVWIDHFRNHNKQLGLLLKSGKVVSHDFIIGELACGSLKNRDEIIMLLNDLQKVPIVEFDEFLFFMKNKHLYGKGIGFVDVHLLASAAISGIPIWTMDKKLDTLAEELGLVQ